MTKPLFSICVPNYNYGSYIKETIESALNQPGVDLEVVVADNLSTDNSVEVIEEIMQKHDNVKLKINRCNVGFYENLKRAASMASGEWMTMLSSDDLTTPDAYPVYKNIIDNLDVEAKKIVLCSTADKIDSKSNKIEDGSIDWKLWGGSRKNEMLSNLVDADVWEISAQVLLKQSLLLMRNPLHFATTTYSKELHDSIEGYSWGGIINPDKQFAWNLISAAEKIIIIDKPYFKYRWHNANQTAQQLESGALKLWVDQYVATFQLPKRVLDKALLDRNCLAKSFVEQDIALRGLLELTHGHRVKAKRILAFGKASYPNLILKSKKVWALRVLLVLGPIGYFIACWLKKIYESRNA